MQLRDLLYYIAFCMLELVAAVEVTAMLVASPTIASILGIPEHNAGWILNAYLYPVFATLLLLLVRNGEWVRHIFSARGIFITGLALFIAGNVLSGLCSTPSFFFAGRLVQAVGGALAYLGQLWTAMVYFKDRLVTVMFWGECGLAVGIISGPMIGGYLCGWGSAGWRMIFFLNAALALATIGAGLAGLLSRKPASSAQSSTTDSRRGAGDIYWLLGLQWAVMVAAVGGEYLLSNDLQLSKGLSAQTVGWVTAAASAGAVAGSGMVASRPGSINSWLRLGLGSLMVFIPMLGICLPYLHYLWNIPILLVVGMGMGMSSVSLYARIAEFSLAEDFIRVSILYLLAQQLGNAVGVQIEELISQLHLHPVITGLCLVVPLLVLFFLAWQNSTARKRTELVPHA